MLRSVLSVLLLSALPPGGGDPDWRFLTFVEPPAGGVMFVDAASISRSGNTVTFTSDLRFKHPEDAVDRTVQKTEADCSNGRYLDRVVTYYSAGKVVRDEINGEPKRTSAPAGSFYAGVLALVCSGSFSRVHVGNVEEAAAKYLAQQ